jgi:chaperonin GroEL
MKEKKMRVEDALHATRAAIEEGILPGGGVALARAASVLDKLKVPSDEQFGVDIVREALDVPLRQIAVNAGREGGKTLNDVLNSKDYNYGFNAMTGKFDDMIKMGIVDPKKVTRISLQNAASVAGVLLTTDALVAEIPEKKKPEMPPGGDPYGGGMGGMGGGMY